MHDMMAVQQLGQLLFSMRKQYGMVVFWFFFPDLFNIFLLSDWLNEGNTIGLIGALIFWLPAFYALADRIRARIYVHQNGLVYQTLFGKKIIPFTPKLQIYIGRIQERVYGINTARHVSVRLVCNQEETKIPSSFLYIEEMIDVLLHYQQKTMLPALVKALQDGKIIKPLP